MNQDFATERTPLPGLMVVHAPRREDQRGFFSEVWSRQAFAQAGLDFDWCQENHAFSRAPAVLRGLHYQAPPKAQAKLVRCTRGRIWDVAVDVRRGSPTELQWWGSELSPGEWRQLLIPRGFLHGYLTLEPDCEVIYMVDNHYAPECDGAVAWDDPRLAIDWPLDVLPDGSPALSDKDRSAPRLSDWSSPFVWEARCESS